MGRPVDRELAATAAGADAVAVCQVLAGLGGVGKTQLAAALAERRWREQEVDLMVWVTATSRTSILARYAQAAADVTGVEDSDPQQGAARFLAWLSTTGRRWLVVLDDITDPNDANGLWPPTTATGCTVVTTRRRDTAVLAGRRLIDVALFTPEEATRYLRGKLADHPDRMDEADALAADLGYLPLAVAQAAAFLLDQAMSCADYRRRLAKRRLADLAPHALPDEHRGPVAATWSLSIDLANGLAPVGVAGPIIELAALLDPDTIPTALFSTAAVTGYYTRRLTRRVDGEDTYDALRLLHRFNLATIDESTSTVRVHGLLQRAVREATNPDHHQSLAVTAADALLDLWPDIERDTTHAQMLRANTTALHTTTGPLLWTKQDGGHPVLFRAGRSLGNTGLVTAAAIYFDNLHNTAEQHLGPDHPRTLAARHRHARCRGELGDAAGAATALELLLADRLRVLGPDHPDTLATRHNLAGWRGHAGDAPGAAAAFGQLLPDVARILGPDHPGTLVTRGNRAYWRGQVGDTAGAATAFGQLLSDIVRVLGPEHPHTLTTRANLARWQGQAGDAAGAATALQHLLPDMLRVLGPNHPDTLASRHQFAGWRGQAGDAAGAATALEQLLPDMLRVLGPDHPHTLTTRANLAHWRRKAGQPAPTNDHTWRQIDPDTYRPTCPD